MNDEMKTYKNRDGIKILFPQAFVMLFLAILIINIIDELKYKEFGNIKYYLMMLIPFAYVMIYFFMNYYGKIYLAEKNIYIGKLLYKKKIRYCEILEINRPNIITLKNIIKLYPDDECFWEELNKNYVNYCNSNIEYFSETKELYANLLEMQYGLRGYEINRGMKRGPGGITILNVLFIWIFFLYRYLAKRKLHFEYSKAKYELKGCIKKYEGKAGSNAFR
jgi:hypothetical protein